MHLLSDFIEEEYLRVKMKFAWETEEERLKHYMKISPKQELQWLREMNEFSAKHLPTRTRSIYLRLKKST